MWGVLICQYFAFLIDKECVLMSFDDVESKELLELRNGGKRIKDEGVIQEQMLLEKYQLRSSNVAEDVKDGGRAVEACAVPLLPKQQPPQGAMVRWERFLHVRSLKVLLVESDDSTRHVVTALLRNCSYEGL